MPEIADREPLLADYFLRFKELWPRGGFAEQPHELSTARSFSFGQGENVGEFQVDVLTLEALSNDRVGQIFTLKAMEDLRRLLGDGPHAHIAVGSEDEEVWKASGIPYGIDKPSVVEYILATDGRGLKYITSHVMEKDQTEKLVPLEGGDIELLDYLLTTARPKLE